MRKLSGVLSHEQIQRHDAFVTSIVINRWVAYAIAEELAALDEQFDAEVALRPTSLLPRPDARADDWRESTMLRSAEVEPYWHASLAGTDWHPFEIG